MRIFIPAALKSKDHAVDVFERVESFVRNCAVLDGRLTFGIRINKTYFGIEGGFLGHVDEFNEKVILCLLEKGTCK